MSIYSEVGDHMAEPWDVGSYDQGAYWVKNDEEESVNVSEDMDEANRDRIEECVNACRTVCNPRVIGGLIRRALAMLQDPFNPDNQAALELSFENLGYEQYLKWKAKGGDAKGKTKTPHQEWDRTGPTNKFGEEKTDTTF
jgi:hypothetical protein